MAFTVQTTIEKCKHTDMKRLYQQVSFEFLFMQNFNCIQFSLYAKFNLHDTCNIETISQYNGAMCLSQFCSRGGVGGGSAAQWWDRIAPKITIKYSKYGRSSFSHTSNCVCFNLFFDLKKYTQKAKLTIFSCLF